MLFFSDVPARLNNERQDILELRTSHFLSPMPSATSHCVVKLTGLPSVPCGLFGSADPKEIAQFHSRFMKLRLAVADRATHHLGDLIMFITFNIVQHKNDSITRRKAFNGAFQI